jgi:hypothetical protein
VTTLTSFSASFKRTISFSFRAMFISLPGG